MGADAVQLHRCFLQGCDHRYSPRGLEVTAGWAVDTPSKGTTSGGYRTSYEITHPRTDAKLITALLEECPAHVRFGESPILAGIRIWLSSLIRIWRLAIGLQTKVTRRTLRFLQRQHLAIQVDLSILSMDIPRRNLRSLFRLSIEREEGLLRLVCKTDLRWSPRASL